MEAHHHSEKIFIILNVDYINDLNNYCDHCNHDDDHYDGDFHYCQHNDDDGGGGEQHADLRCEDCHHHRRRNLCCHYHDHDHD